MKKEADKVGKEYQGGVVKAAGTDLDKAGRDVKAGTVKTGDDLKKVLAKVGPRNWPRPGTRRPTRPRRPGRTRMRRSRRPALASRAQRSGPAPSSRRGPSRPSRGSRKKIRSQRSGPRMSGSSSRASATGSRTSAVVSRRVSDPYHRTTRNRERASDRHVAQARQPPQPRRKPEALMRETTRGAAPRPRPEG